MLVCDIVGAHQASLLGVLLLGNTGRTVLGRFYSCPQTEAPESRLAGTAGSGVGVSGRRKQEPVVNEEGKEAGQARHGDTSRLESPLPRELKQEGHGSPELVPASAKPGVTRF